MNAYIYHRRNLLVSSLILSDIKITLAGPGMKELPTLIQPGQLNKLGISGFEHTEGRKAGELIQNQPSHAAMDIYVHDRTRPNISDLESNNH